MLQKNKIIAGIDDATKCPCIGSIFIAGVIADEDTIAKWKELGVKDSKLVSAKKRDKLAEIIKQTAIGFSIQEIKPEMIDNKTFNLNDWEMLVVLNIVKKLQKFGQPEQVFIDNWETSEKGFWRRFQSILHESVKEKIRSFKFTLNKKKLSSLNYVPEHKADENYTVVGAASILAKTSSDQQYRKYKSKYGNFGSGSPGDPTTRLFVWQHRKDPLPIIRQSWNTFKTLSALDNIEDDYWYARKLTKVQTTKI